MVADIELKAEKSGRLYVFEPEIDGDDERLVLLTNGFIGTMSSNEIRHSVNAFANAASSFESGSNLLSSEGI